MWRTVLDTHRIETSRGVTAQTLFRDRSRTFENIREGQQTLFHAVARAAPVPRQSEKLAKKTMKYW
jgi:hypothetical protein